MGSSQVRRKTYILCSTLVTGGAEMVVSYLARGLPGMGHPVELLCLRTPGTVGERLAGQGIPLTSGIARRR
ncbi:MAG TPA: hypothetical protein VLA34_05175, partial [Candidatus Krumholzibacterium sp.]|nr:hypothetical protein [Candidatus Krumholzibacterium sp.]